MWANCGESKWALYQWDCIVHAVLIAQTIVLRHIMCILVDHLLETSNQTKIYMHIMFNSSLCKVLQVRERLHEKPGLHGDLFLTRCKFGLCERQTRQVAHRWQRMTEVDLSCFKQNVGLNKPVECEVKYVQCCCLPSANLWTNSTYWSSLKNQRRKDQWRVDEIFSH